MKTSKDEIQNSPGYFKHMKDSRINTPESRRCMEASQICICYYIFRAWRQCPPESASKQIINSKHFRLLMTSLNAKTLSRVLRLLNCCQFLPISVHYRKSEVPMGSVRLREHTSSSIWESPVVSLCSLLCTHQTKLAGRSQYAYLNQNVDD